MSLSLKTRIIHDVTIVDAIGKITFGADSASFRVKIIDLLMKGQKKILLNMAEVSYVDSSGIFEMVSASTKILNDGGQFKIMTLNKRVKDLFQITKLYTVFEIFGPDEEDRAVRSFN